MTIPNDFQKNYDDLLTDILMSYKNLDPSPDVTVGSPTFIWAAVQANMLYGLYRYLDFIDREVFPDTASTDGLNHWGTIYGVSRLTTDTDSIYLNRILSLLRQPPAGGTALDYYNWTLAAATVDSPLPATQPENFSPSAVNTGTNQITVAQDWYNTDQVQFTTTGTLPSGLSLATNYYVINIDATHVQISASSGGAAISLGTQGTGQHTMTATDTGRYYVGNATIITPMSPQPSEAGTVEIYFVPYDTISNSKVPSSLTRYTQLVNTLSKVILDYVNIRRPVTAFANPVTAAAETDITIDITVTPNTITLDIINQMQTDISAYVNSLNPGDPLYRAQLSAICLRDGALNASVNAPATDYTTPNTEVVISSSITVHF
jgi:uncharacterized phage protein gp47/JayE